MKPVLIFRFVSHEGPGYLGTFLDEQDIPWQLVKVDSGEFLTGNIADYSGLVLMGGPMSVNDDLPWIAPLLALIIEAKEANIPLLGHCLGGQLISKALGAEVSANPVKEIGWGKVNVTKNEAAAHWFGAIEQFNAFHWHGETFRLPAGATHLLGSDHCQNQAYSIGKHIALQTHIEVTAEMVINWCDQGETELAESASSLAVQQADEMQQDLTLHCFFLHRVAKQVYSRWIEGLVH